LFSKEDAQHSSICSWYIAKVSCWWNLRNWKKGKNKIKADLSWIFYLTKEINEPNKGSDDKGIPSFMFFVEKRINGIAD